MNVTDPALAATAPAHEPPDDPAVDDTDVEVLPWFYNPINLIAIAIGLLLVAGSLGWVLGNNHAQPDPNATDVGFLQDMRDHHEQAVQLSFLYLTDEGTDANLRQLAREIIVGQNLEAGQMVQMLREFGEPEANEDDVAMRWMGAPTPLDSMPGMATESDFDALGAQSGKAADTMFVQLMVAHHQGGIHMAEYAADHAGTSMVREFAAQIAGAETEEISEMQALLARV